LTLHCNSSQELYVLRVGFKKRPTFEIVNSSDHWASQQHISKYYNNK